MNLGRRRSRDRAGAERGSVLAIAAIGMLSGLLIAGLCVDVSHLYMAKIELQDAADAAALAAASQLSSTAGGIRSAVTEATKVLNKYDVKQDVTIPSSAVTFSINLNGPYLDQTLAEVAATNIRFVRVTIPPKPVGMSLAATVLGDTQNVGAAATAGMSVALTMNKFYSAMVFIEPNGDESINIFELGKTYTLGPKQWNSSDPHSYHILAGTGGDLIMTGTIHAYGYPNGTYTVAQLDRDNDCRVAKIGVNTRFGDYSVHPNVDATDEPPDTIINQNISYSAYREMQGNNVVERSDGVKNRRIITIPVAKTADYKPTQGQVVADRIAAFFLKKKIDATCNLEVEAIGGHFVVPVGEYQTGNIQLGELSIAVLYK
jgi:Flp pilus assembly protein TadG